MFELAIVLMIIKVWLMLVIEFTLHVIAVLIGSATITALLVKWKERKK